MRACFLGQTICALGNGIAVLTNMPIGDEAVGVAVTKADERATSESDPSAQTGVPQRVVSKHSNKRT